MFDSHCHLQDERMAQVWRAALLRAGQVGVRGVLLAGVDEADWIRQEQVLRAGQALGIDVVAAAGLHPQVVAGLESGEVMRQIAALAQRLRQPATCPRAVGEVGLDALGEARKATLPLQEQAFRQQLALCREADLPIVLHILRAHPQALRVLRGDGAPRRGGVVHSYSGSAEQVRDYLRLGLSISFAGPVTYDDARRIHAAVQAVPRERLLCETDAPDQTPRSRRPAHNEPAFLPDIIAAVARLRGEDPEDVARYTEENARRLFCC